MFEEGGMVRSNSSVDENKWFVRYGDHYNASMRLFCFPYAGGSPTAFENWIRHLPKDIEILAIRLPGHYSRIREKPYTDWHIMLNDILNQINPFLDKPYAFFGHSFGARLAFELTLRIQETKNRQPEHLYVSGCRCPHKPHGIPLLHNMSLDRFTWHVLEMNENMRVLENANSIVKILEPALRSEIKLSELWGGEKSAVNVPLTAFCGMDDPLDTPAKMLEWGCYTRSDFAFHTLPGGHFFLHSHEAQLLELIAHDHQSEPSSALAAC